MTSRLTLETFVGSPGLSFVVAKIFILLDCQSLANCEQVSADWRDLIVEHRVWRRKLFQFLAPPNSYNRRKVEYFVQDPDTEIDHSKCRKLCWKLCFDLEMKWLAGNFSVLRITEPRSVRDVQVSEHLIVCAGAGAGGLFVADRGDVEKLETNGFRFTDSSFIETSEVSCLGIDPETRFVVTAHRDRRLVFWRPTRRDELQSLQEVYSIPNAHERLITKIKVKDDVIFTSSRDRSVKIWKLDGLDSSAPVVRIIHKLDTANHSVWAIDWRRPFLVTCSTDKCLRVWHVTTEHDSAKVLEFCVFPNEWANIRNVLFLKSHPHLILSGDLLGELTVWNVSTRSLQYEVKGQAKHRGLFNDEGAVVALSQTENFVAVAFGNYRVSIYATLEANLRLKHTRIVDLFEQLSSTGLIRSLSATDTELYVATVAGKEGLFVFSAWPRRVCA